MKRRAWVLMCGHRVVGVALNHRIAKQALMNVQRYAGAAGASEYYLTHSLPVYTQKFVAPKGFERETA